MPLPEPLCDAFNQPNPDRSPILHHLNADSSWLLQIPYPKPLANATRRRRRFFNILLDPWLSGPQSDVASWFSKQWHAIPPRYSSIQAVEALCRDVEEAVNKPDLGSGADAEEGDAAASEAQDGLWIDAVAISHEFTDHCHEGTMRELNPDTPVFANDKAIQLIKSWNHFRPSSIHEIPPFSPAWLSSSNSPPASRSPLPDHVSLSRLQNGGDFLYYHSAIVIAFQLDPAQPGNSLIYTPHGLPASDTDPFARCEPPLRALALLHGLHDVRIPWGGPFSRATQQLNLGAHNALKLQRLLKAKYWLSTHDEVKKGGGLVGWILKRNVISLEDALIVEGGVDGEGGADGTGGAEVVDLENGRAMILS